MRRRFAMFAICGSRNSRSDDEESKITDSLEQCLQLDKGVKDLQAFLRKGRFCEDEAALEFYLRCRSILTETAKWSPNSRNQVFSRKLCEDASALYDMAYSVNFDQRQMEILEDAFTCGTDSDKIDKICQAQKWSMDILQKIYETFRKDTLENAR